MIWDIHFKEVCKNNMEIIYFLTSKISETPILKSSHIKKRSVSLISERRKYIVSSWILQRVTLFIFFIKLWVNVHPHCLEDELETYKSLLLLGLLATTDHLMLLML